MKDSKYYLTPFNQEPDTTIGKCTFKRGIKGTIMNVNKCKDLNENDCMNKVADCQLNREPIKMTSTKKCNYESTLKIFQNTDPN